MKCSWLVVNVSAKLLLENFFGIYFKIFKQVLFLRQNPISCVLSIITRQKEYKLYDINMSKHTSFNLFFPKQYTHWAYKHAHTQISVVAFALRPPVTDCSNLEWEQLPWQSLKYQHCPDIYFYFSNLQGGENTCCQTLIRTSWSLLVTQFLSFARTVLCLRCIVFPSVCPIPVTAISQERLEGISSNMAQMFTWTRGHWLIRFWWSKVTILYIPFILTGYLRNTLWKFLVTSLTNLW